MNLVRISIRATPGLCKSDRQEITHFLRYVERKFTDLPVMLKKDYIYSPFAFIGHRRGNEHICSTSDLAILDVDTTVVSIQQRYQQLVAEGLAFIIATTSDIYNMYKYRILFLLDRPVDQFEYRLLIHGISTNGLVTDLDMGASVKAGGFLFAYKDSLVLSNFNGSPLGVSDYAIEPEDIDYFSMDSAELMDTFEQEFRRFTKAAPGKRTRNLLATAFKLLESGCSYEQIRTGVLAVNSSMLLPKPIPEVHRRVLSKFKRK